jgi:methyltransferase (TIGR00027 family)
MASIDGDAVSDRPLKTKISLTGVSETMLITLAGRAEDSRKPNSILHDTWAADAFDQLDYTWKRTRLDKGFYATNLLRGRLFDTWTTEFLNANPEATVLHLACGLDSRAFRVNWGPGVRWVDVDMPEVVALREKVMPSPSSLRGDYKLVASSVTESAWLEDIPADRPTVVVMEGLLPYLGEDGVKQLLQRICDRFPSGQLMFDVAGSFLLRIQALNRPISRTGAIMTFGLDNPSELSAMVPKLEVMKSLRVGELPGFENFPWPMRLVYWLYSWIPGLRALVSYMRCEF